MVSYFVCCISKRQKSSTRKLNLSGPDSHGAALWHDLALIGH